jgi:hypothetical protein
MTTALLQEIDLMMVQITSMITTEYHRLFTPMKLSMTEINCIGPDILNLNLLGMLGLMPIGMNSKESKISIL